MAPDVLRCRRFCSWGDEQAANETTIYFYIRSTPTRTQTQKDNRGGRKPDIEPKGYEPKHSKNGDIFEEEGEDSVVVQGLTVEHTKSLDKQNEDPKESSPPKEKSKKSKKEKEKGEGNAEAVQEAALNQQQEKEQEKDPPTLQEKGKDGLFSFLFRSRIKTPVN